MSLISALRFWLFPLQNPRPNIGLHGDLDDVECLEAVEEYFSIRFTDAEAMALSTVGDFLQAVLIKRPDLDPDAASCNLTPILALHGEAEASEITPGMEFFRHV